MRVRFGSKVSPEAAVFGKNVLTIKGNPGCGKTVLCASAVDEIMNFPNRRVCYFFLQYWSDSNNAVAAYRALLAQILQGSQQNQTLLDQFVFSMSQISSGQLVASRDELVDLLQFCIQNSIEDWFLILDGIDECNDNSSLVKGILQATKNTNARILLFSRPNVAALNESIPPAQRLQVGRCTSKDIAHFSSRKLKILVDFGLLPRQPKRSELVTKLVLGADGMFLWIHLMVEYLKSSALQPVSRVDIIMAISLPEGLEAMYSRIWNLICQGRKVEQNLAKWVIKWLAFSERPLSSEELQDSTHVMDGDMKSRASFPNFERAVVEACASLVESVMVVDSRSSKAVVSFRFIHLSAQDFFTTTNITTDYSISVADSHLDIARGCLQYLTFYVPAQPLSGKVGQDATTQDLEQAFPLQNYALSYWLHHILTFALHPHDSELSRAGARPSVFQSFQHTFTEFMTQKGVQMAWIEASYTLEGTMKFRDLTKWANWALSGDNPHADSVQRSQQIYHDVLEYAQYLEVLQNEWGSQLRKSPSCIWEEVTAFTPSRMLAQTETTRVDVLIGENPEEQHISSKHLCKISEVDTEGSFVGILSIWPSR
jgi:hypothetical protein